MINARQAAALVVYDVSHKGESLDTALAHNCATLAANETPLYQEIAYGGVRWYLAYLDYLNHELKKPFKAKDAILNAILITAFYQLDYTQQVPYAVVNEAVSLTTKLKRKWAAGVVNVILRNYLRKKTKQSTIEEPNWYRQSFPDWLYNEICKAWPKYCTHIIHASQEKPPMTVRVNTQHHSCKDYLKLLQEAGIDATHCTDSAIGIELQTPIQVSKLPGFTKAWVSVQDEAAQLAIPVLDLEPGQNVLDACAAPGGKSMHILEHEPDLQLSVLDFSHRMGRLRENFARASLIANVIEGNLLQPQNWWDGRLFDRILLDAPCTGTGVIRRHPDIKLRRQAENVLQFAVNQQNLLANALEMLKPGGKLLYTTCSILTAENEQCVAQFIAQTPKVNALDLPEKLGVNTTHGRQRLPGVHSGDGFFYALLQKSSS